MAVAVKIIAVVAQMADVPVATAAGNMTGQLPAGYTDVVNSGDGSSVVDMIIIIATSAMMVATKMMVSTKAVVVLVLFIMAAVTQQNRPTGRRGFLFNRYGLGELQLRQAIAKILREQPALEHALPLNLRAFGC